jgi:hypothetical protein
MNAIDIVTLIAIILFARLGIRLVGKYLSMKDKPTMKEESDDKIDSGGKNEEE